MVDRVRRVAGASRDLTARFYQAWGAGDMSVTERQTVALWLVHPFRGAVSCCAGQLIMALDGQVSDLVDG